MGGMQIQSLIAGVVVFVISLVLFEPLARGADTLYREFVPHCEISGESFLKVKTDATPPVQSTVTSTSCPTGTGNSTAGTYITESKTEYTITTTGFGGVWTTPAKTLTKFGGINKLVLSLLPLVVVVGFMSTSFMSLYSNRSGGQSVGNTIKAEVGALVIALIAIFVSPIALDYIATSSVVISDGQLSSTKEFGLIMELLFGFMPVGLTLGIIALVGWRGQKAYSGMKGGGGMMG